METFGTDDNLNKFANAGQAAVDKTVDRVRGGIKDAQQAANSAGAALSNKVEGFRSKAVPVIDKVTGQVEDIANQSKEAGLRVSQQAREYASQASDSLISFTKENPVKALLIAVASGALLISLVKSLTPSRD